MDDLNTQRFKRLQSQLQDAERILAGQPGANELTGLLEEIDRTWRFSMPGMFAAGANKEPVEPWVEGFESLREKIGQAHYRRNHL